MKRSDLMSGSSHHRCTSLCIVLICGCLACSWWCRDIRLRRSGVGGCSSVKMLMLFIYGRSQHFVIKVRALILSFLTSSRHFLGFVSFFSQRLKGFKMFYYRKMINFRMVNAAPLHLSLTHTHTTLLTVFVINICLLIFISSLDGLEWMTVKHHQTSYSIGTPL